MSRLALAVLLLAASLVGASPRTSIPVVRPVAGSVPPPAVTPLRASRAEQREPLPRVNAVQSGEGATTGTRHAPSVSAGPSRPARGSGSLAQTTMYCATGSRNADGRWPQLGDVATLDRSIPFGTRVLIAGRVYVVRDRVGSGTSFDVFGGNDVGCERRALEFGRRWLRVVVL